MENLTKLSQIEASERRLRHFVEQSPYAVAMFDKEMRYLFCSDEWFKNNQIEKQSLAGKCHYEVFPEALIRRDIHIRCLAGTSEKRESEKVIRNGQVKWFRWEFRPWYTESDEIGGLIVYNEDITDKMVLHRERERLYQLPNHLLCILNEESQFKSINAGFTYTLGYEQTDLIGKSVWDLVHPDDLARSQEAEKRGRTSIIHAFENRVRAKNGQYLWLRWTGTIIDGLNYSAAVNITDEKKQEEILRQSEQKFLAIFEHSPMPKSLMTWPGVEFCDVNPAWMALFGYSKEEVLGKTTIEIGMIRDVERRAYALNLLETNGFAEDSEIRAFTKSGKPLILSASVQVFELNGQKYVLFMQVDITETKKLEKQLTATFSQAAVGIAHVSADGKWLKINRKLCEIVGYTEEELLKQSFQDITHPDDLPQDLELVRKMLNREIDQYTFEKRYIRKDGSTVWVNLSVALVWKPNGDPDFFVSIIQDISEGKKVEKDRAELAVRERSAQEASRLKSEFLANMSHEIRTPLNGIVGMTGLLLDTRLSVEQRDYAETVRKSADTLLSIINDILDFSKVEAGKLDFEKVEFDLQHLIEDLHKTFLFSAQKKKLPFLVFGDLFWKTLYKGDPARITQVLTNLLGNAIKFTHVGRIVLVVTQLSDDENSTEFLFEIQDTGVGIPPYAMDRLFKAFSQADSTVTRRFGGTGLGLSISKKLVQLMGGEIGVTSEEGKGSNFWFKLKLEKGSDAGCASSNRQVYSRTIEQKKRNIRILLAEDNAINQKVAIRQLEKLGYRVDSVANGREAIEALKSIPYDLVLMDCQMPELDGYEATRMIRTNSTEKFYEIPIIAMTANAVSGDKERCLQVGMSDYISKLVRLDELESVLDKWVSKLAPAVDM